MLLTRPKVKPDQFLVDEILRRLNPPLPTPASRPVDMPVLPSPVITRSMVDVGEPPVDPLMGMEAARNTDYQPNYSTGVASFPSRAPEIPEPLSRSIDVAPDPSQPQFGNEVISRSMAPMYRSKLEALQNSSPQSRIETVDGGYSVAPPQRMSRLKAFGLGALRGLGMGGLGGLLTGGVIGAVSPNTIQNFERRQQIGTAQEDEAQRIQLERAGLQNQDIQAQIVQRNAAAVNAPLAQRQKAEEAERDNLRQLYNAQPYFDANSNPQHKAIAERAKALGIVLPNRDEKDASQLEWVNGELKRVDRRTGKVSSVTDQGGPLIRRADVPVVEDGLNVTPGQALNARSNQAKIARENQTANYEGQGQESLAAHAEQDAQDAQNAVWQMEFDLKQMPKFVRVDKTTGAIVPEGGSAENVELRANPDVEAQRTAIAAKRGETNDATRRARELRAGASVNRSKGSLPPVLTRSTPTGQAWSASRWARANPGGDVEAAKRAAIAAGHQVVE